MPRRERILFPGAMYHVIARTLDERPVFDHVTILEASEQALFELAASFKWKIHAHAFLHDAMHLFIKTEGADLPQGMKWLIAQIAARYNRENKRVGHVFAGRYKSMLVENDQTSMLGLVHFIHAAPARRTPAVLTNLHTRRGTSLYHYAASSPPPCLDRAWLLNLIGESHPRKGLQIYRQRLIEAHEASAGQAEELNKRYCRGWFIGTPETKLRFARKLAGIDPEAIWTGSDLKELNEAKWELVLENELSQRAITPQKIRESSKGAPWKAEIACLLRRETSANNVWIAKKLHMGHPNRVSMVLNEARKKKPG